MENPTLPDPRTQTPQTRRTKATPRKGAKHEGESTSVVNDRSKIIPFQPEQKAATEGGHWYLPDGSPYYTVTAKSTGKERPVTIRDARKVEAVPSVTTIFKILGSAGLERYKLRQLFDAIMDAEWTGAEDRDSLFERVLALSKTHAARRADEGGKLHGAIELFLQGKPFDEVWRPHVDKIIATLAQRGIDIHSGEPERSFAHPLGFGGKCDWHRRETPLILDFKSKDKLEIGKKKYGYDEQLMQVVAYANGLGIPDAIGINIFVGCEDQQVLIHEWTPEDMTRGWAQFQLLARYWQLSKNYFPKL